MGACLENMKAEIDANQEMKARQEVMETYLERGGVSH